MKEPEQTDLVTADNGFVYFWPEGYSKGMFSSHNLREIADWLDEKNSAWQEQLDTYMKEQEPDAMSDEQRAKKTLTTKGEELIERLRRRAANRRQDIVHATDEVDGWFATMPPNTLEEWRFDAEEFEQTADALQALIGERDALKAALRPFAKLIGDEPDQIWSEDKDHWTAFEHEWGRRVTIGMVRQVLRLVRDALPTSPVDVSGDREDK
jgi:hypothetical protein